MIAYAFTLKMNTKPDEVCLATRSKYEDVLVGWAIQADLRARVFERDKQGRLHVHGIIELPRDFRYKTLCPKGFHTCFKEIHDLAGWKKYLRKDQNFMKYVLHDPYSHHNDYIIDLDKVGSDTDSDGDTAEVISKLKHKLFPKV